MEQTVYKLRHKETGMYHCGGSDPVWGFGGETYDTRAHCTTLINQWNKAYKKALKANEEGALWNTRYYLTHYPTPEKLEIVEFVLTETEANVYQGTEVAK